MGKLLVITLILGLTFCLDALAQVGFPVEEGGIHLCYQQEDGSFKLGHKDGKKIFGKVLWSEKKLRKASRRLSKEIRTANANTGSAIPADQKKLKLLKKNRKQIQKALAMIGRCSDALPDDSDDDDDNDDDCNGSFEPVSIILQSNCMGCHNAPLGGLGAWQLTSEWLVSSGLVVPGDHLRSELYKRLRGNPEGLLPANMPQVGSSLATEEINQISCWINSLVPPGEEPGPVSFTCNETETPAPRPLMRLTSTEYRNSIIDLLIPLSSLPGEYAAIRSVVDAELTLLPEDRVNVEFLEVPKFSTLANNISQPLIDTWYRVAAKLAEEVTLTPQRRAAFAEVGCDPGISGASENCILSWLSRLGLKVYRRPLTTSELNELKSFYDSSQADSPMSDTIIRLLLAPRFLFHLEIDGTPINGDDTLLRLTPYELLSRLTFTFWQTTPTAALYEAVAGGALSTEGGYLSMVEEIFHDSAQERTRDTIRNMFSELLHFRNIPPINSGNTAAFDAFKGDLEITPGDESFGVAVREDVLSLVDYYTWETEGSLEDLLTSNLSFVQNPALADIYQVEPWEGSNSPPLQLPEPRGIFARTAFLMSGSEDHLPIRRGGRILREWLCQEVPPPSPEVADMVAPPPPNPSLSTRERFHTITSVSPCSVCHQRINPPGFALEQYDSIGRNRALELIFDITGGLLAQHEVNSATTMDIMPGVTREISSPQEIVQHALEKNLPQACFSRQAMRYFTRRDENIQKDGCALQALQANLSGDEGSFKKFFKQIALSDQFRMSKRAE